MKGNFFQTIKQPLFLFLKIVIVLMTLFLFLFIFYQYYREYMLSIKYHMALSFVVYLDICFICFYIPLFPNRKACSKRIDIFLLALRMF